MRSSVNSFSANGSLFETNILKAQQTLDLFRRLGFFIVLWTEDKLIQTILK